MTCGIYKITHVSRGRCYVGSATDVQKRWVRHRSELRRGIHKNKYLQSAWSLYGEDDFCFEVIGPCGRDELAQKEQEAIDANKAFWKLGGFNLCPQARTTLGRPGSENQKETTRRRLVGVPNPTLSSYLKTPERAAKSAEDIAKLRSDPEVQAKRLERLRAALRDPVNREKYRIAQTGRKFSAEHRANLSLARKRTNAAKRALGIDPNRPRGVDGKFLGGSIPTGPGTMAGAMGIGGGQGQGGQ